MAEESMDLSGAVDMLKGLLSGEEGQQTLQNVMGMLGVGQPEPSPGVATGGIDPDNLAMVMQLQKAMGLMNQQKNNSQTRLLMALKPFLKPARQEKVEHAMQMLKLSQVLAVMKEAQEDG